MKRRTKQTIAAFLITIIFIGALCGFAAVDLSTQRYMPDDYGPLFRITSIDSQGIRFSALGERYIIAADLALDAKETIWRHRGFLPGSVLAAGNLTVQALLALQEAQAQQYPEDIW